MATPRTQSRATRPVRTRSRRGRALGLGKEGRQGADRAVSQRDFGLGLHKIEGDIHVARWRQRNAVNRFTDALGDAPSLGLGCLAVDVKDQVWHQVSLGPNKRMD